MTTSPWPSSESPTDPETGSSKIRAISAAHGLGTDGHQSAAAIGNTQA
jgi:hypothetical protein